MVDLGTRVMNFMAGMVTTCTSSVSLSPATEEVIFSIFIPESENGNPSAPGSIIGYGKAPPVPEPPIMGTMKKAKGGHAAALDEEELDASVLGWIEDEL